MKNDKQTLNHLKNMHTIFKIWINWIHAIMIQLLCTKLLTHNYYQKFKILHLISWIPLCWTCCKKTSMFFIWIKRLYMYFLWEARCYKKKTTKNNQTCCFKELIFDSCVLLFVGDIYFERCIWPLPGCPNKHRPWNVLLKFKRTAPFRARNKPYRPQSEPLSTRSVLYNLCKTRPKTNKKCSYRAIRVQLQSTA